MDKLINTIRKLREENSDRNYAALLERMYRRADRGLLEYNRAQIKKAVDIVNESSETSTSKRSFILEIAELEECIKKYDGVFDDEIINEAVTYIDNAGNLKTKNAIDYVKDMHEYNTETQIKKYKKEKKKEYNLVSEEISLDEILQDVLREVDDGK